VADFFGATLYMEEKKYPDLPIYAVKLMSIDIARRK